MTNNELLIRNIIKIQELHNLKLDLNEAQARDLLLEMQNVKVDEKIVTKRINEMQRLIYESNELRRDNREYISDNMIMRFYVANTIYNINGECEHFIKKTYRPKDIENWTYDNIRRQGVRDLLNIIDKFKASEYHNVYQICKMVYVLEVDGKTYELPISLNTNTKA